MDGITDNLNMKFTKNVQTSEYCLKIEPKNRKEKKHSLVKYIIL